MQHYLCSRCGVTLADLRKIRSVLHVNLALPIDEVKSPVAVDVLDFGVDPLFLRVGIIFDARTCARICCNSSNTSTCMLNYFIFSDKSHC